MIKGYIIRDEFISVMKNSTSVLGWMEGRSEYQAQLAAILIAPDVIFQQLKTRFQYRDDMFLVPDKITYSYVIPPLQALGRAHFSPACLSIACSSPFFKVLE